MKQVLLLSVLLIFSTSTAAIANVVYSQGPSTSSSTTSPALINPGYYLNSYYLRPASIREPLYCNGRLVPGYKERMTRKEYKRYIQQAENCN